MKYIIANWKLNMDAATIDKWVKTWNDLSIDTDSKILIAASHIHIHHLSKLTNVENCAQDVSIYERGAHTGEVGAFQIAELCKYSIVGHSERMEDVQTVIKKAQLCLKNNITPIICFTDPTKVGTYELDGAILAWEDPSNISQDGVFKDTNMQSIQKAFETMRGLIAQNTVLLYGGSVNKENSKELNALPRLDGVLVGSASTDALHFHEIIKSLK